MASTLASHLDPRNAEGKLYERLPDNAVRCVACGHRCLIREGRRGICKVRFNEGGRLLVPRNYVAVLQCDPVEKKPFFHVLPGTNALTCAMSALPPKRWTSRLTSWSPTRSGTTVVWW